MASKSLLTLLLVTSRISSIVATACPRDTDYYLSGACFTFVQQQLTYQDARNWCHYNNGAVGSYLAIVHNRIISNFLASTSAVAFNTNSGSFWIGLSRPDTSSPFIWDDGEPCIFSGFRGEQENNFVAENTANGYWSTFGPDMKLNFVCYYDAFAPPTFPPPTGVPTYIPTSSSPSRPKSTWLTTQYPSNPTTTSSPICGDNRSRSRNDFSMILEVSHGNSTSNQ